MPLSPAAIPRPLPLISSQTLPTSSQTPLLAPRLDIQTPPRHPNLAILMAPLQQALPLPVPPREEVSSSSSSRCRVSNRTPHIFHLSSSSSRRAGIPPRHKPIPLVVYPALAQDPQPRLPLCPGQALISSNLRLITSHQLGISNSNHLRHHTSLSSSNKRSSNLEATMAMVFRRPFLQMQMFRDSLFPNRGLLMPNQPKAMLLTIITEPLIFSMMIMHLYNNYCCQKKFLLRLIQNIQKLE